MPWQSESDRLLWPVEQADQHQQASGPEVISDIDALCNMRRTAACSSSQPLQRHLSVIGSTLQGIILPIVTCPMRLQHFRSADIRHG